MTKRDPDPLMLAIRLTRRQREISQSDLGALIESDGGQVSRWELGDTDPRLSTVRRLLDALGMDVVLVDKASVR
jgi:predicted transcriptional regulator